MAIPNFNYSDVLPPFTGYDPTVPSNMSPYKTSLIEIYQKLCTSTERIRIFEGLLNYRIELKKIGLVKGFQWINGSFSENVENIRKRPPNDIDLITFAYSPNTITDLTSFRDHNLPLFDPNQTKKQFFCDAYYLDLKLNSEYIVQVTKYFFGLFSHQRDSYLWKGMLEVPLSEDETIVRNMLPLGEGYATSTP